MKYKPIPDHENDIDPKELEDPFKNPYYGWILRFIVSAFFGLLAATFLFLVGMSLCRFGVIASAAALYFKAIHIFWILPILWGILGIFFFETMVDGAKNMIEDYLDV